MKSWAEVENAPEFSALSAAEQNAAREQYFAQVVAPQVPQEELGAARSQFDAATRIKKQDLPAGVTPSQAGAGRGFVNPPVVTPDSLAMRTSTFVGRGSAPSKPPPSTANQSVLDRVRPPEIDAAARDAQTDQLLRDEVAPWKRAETARLGDYVSGARAPSAKPLTVAENLAADVRDATKNPVARGAVAGFFDLGQVGAGAVRLAADVAGADDVSQFAAGASRVGKAMSEGSMQGLQGNDKLIAQVTNSIMVSAPSMAVGVMGGPALRTLFAQSALAEYNEGRNAGFDPGQSAARAGIMGLAEALGERFGFPQQIKVLKGLVKGMPSNEMAKTVGEMIAKEIPGEQLTTAMQFLADKIGPAAQRPNATLADYLEAAGDTLKVTIAQSAVMGGGPAVIATARDAQRQGDKAIERSAMSVPERAAADARFGTASMDPKQAAALAIEASPYGRAKAKGFNIEPPLATDPPETQRSKVESVFRNAAAAFGVPKKAVDAAMQAADGKPLAELPGFFARFTQGLWKRGLVKVEVDPEVIDAIAHGPVDPGAQPNAQPQPAEDYTGLADTTPAPAPEAVQAVENIGRILGFDKDQPAPIVGDPINRKWTAFSPESGTLDIPREQMPQIRAEHRGALVNFLNARGVTHEQQEVPAASLKPTQREFSARKVQDAADYEGGNRSILVSSDGHILDGTHQWLAALDSGASVGVIRLNAPITDLLRLAHQFPSSTTATGPKSTTSGGTNERVGDLATDAGQPAGAGDGRGNQPGGSLGAVGLVPDAPGGVVPLPATPTAGGGSDTAVADGGGPGSALIAGTTIDLDGKPYRVTFASPAGATIADAAGNKRVVRAGSPTWQKITRAQAGTPAEGAGASRPTPAPAQEATTQGGADEVAQQPQTQQPDGVRGEAEKSAPPKPRINRGGNGPLDAISRVGGISPTIIADLSRKTQRIRTSKTGKQTQYTAWHNPMAGGKGPVFRQGGTADLNELARILEEEGFLERGLLERDYLEANSRVQDILKAALNGEKPLRVGDADAIEREMRSRQEAAMDDAPDLTDLLSDDDLASAGYTEASPKVRELTDRLIEEADAAGIDTEALREDTARQSEGLTEDEYHAALQQAVSQALAQHRESAAARDTRGTGAGDSDRVQATGPPGPEGSNRADRPDAAVRAAEGLTLESQTAADLAAKTEREAAAAEADRKRQKELEDRARADAMRDEFTLTGSDRPADVAAAAGQRDIFDRPANEPEAQPRQLTDDEAFADNFARFDGKPVEQTVMVQSTGQTATLTMDSAAAMRELDSRHKALLDLMRCLEKAA